MTEARSIEGAEGRTASNEEQLAHVRPAVERWLTWSGLIPLPVFLVLHLLRELKLAFATDVSDVLRAEPTGFATATSWLLVWLPLLVHVALGGARWLSGRTASPPPDVPATARLVSRATSVLALCFLVYHARGFALPVWLGEAAAEDAGFRLLAELSSTRWGVPLSGGVYLLGLLATVTHAGLGVHRGLLREGWLRSSGRRRLSARLCAGSGAALFCVGAAAVIRVASGVLLR